MSEKKNKLNSKRLSKSERIHGRRVKQAARKETVLVKPKKAVKVIEKPLINNE